MRFRFSCLLVCACVAPAIHAEALYVIEQLVVTNTIPLTSAARDCKKITQLSVGRIFGEAIRRIYSADSLSSLFV